MQRFGSDGSNSGHGGCALETALLTLIYDVSEHAHGPVSASRNVLSLVPAGCASS
jgi:hypothetical protein